jgi:hypothetical protein
VAQALHHRLEVTERFRQLLRVASKSLRGATYRLRDQEQVLDLAKTELLQAYAPRSQVSTCAFLLSAGFCYPPQGQQLRQLRQHGFHFAED